MRTVRAAAVAHRPRSALRLQLYAAAFVSVSLTANASEVAGIKLDEHVRVDNAALVLNGAGVRRTFLRKVYLVALYLVEKKSSPAAVYASGGPKRIHIVLLRDVPARKLVDALDEAICDNSSRDELATLHERSQALAAMLLRRRRGARGDVIAFDWLPDAGTVISVNGQPQGAALPGEDFYRALLRCWLGNRPASVGLRKALLQRSR